MPKEEEEEHVVSWNIWEFDLRDTEIIPHEKKANLKYVERISPSPWNNVLIKGFVENGTTLVSQGNQTGENGVPPEEPSESEVLPQPGQKDV
jgi:hypothetical protein